MHFSKDNVQISDLALPLYRPFILKPPATINDNIFVKSDKILKISTSLQAHK